MNNSRLPGWLLVIRAGTVGYQNSRRAGASRATHSIDSRRLIAIEREREEEENNRNYRIKCLSEQRREGKNKTNKHINLEQKKHICNEPEIYFCLGTTIL